MSVKLPEGITLKSLKSLYDEAYAEYSPAFRKARILDGTDKGKMWDMIGATFPDYQILPNTNHLAYVKNNILANVYTVGKAAELEPTSEGDKDLIKGINIAIENAWSRGYIGYKQLQAGERASILNKGVTKVSWDNTKSGGKGDAFYKGEPDVKNINPLKFMRDPYAEDMNDAAYAMTWDFIHENVLKRDPDYTENFKEFQSSNTQTAPAAEDVANANDRGNVAPTSTKYLKVYEFYVMDTDGNGKPICHEIHTIEFKYVLLYKERKPAIIPFDELYCNIPVDDVFGTSEPARIYSNSVAINLINSFALTAEYKNQRPPKYVSKAAGLDVSAFMKHGNDADHTFVVGGDATKSVHYHRFPEVSAQATQLLQQLGIDIKQITGVDERYTGRDTGSILTTGGVENMLDQVTMIDQYKIMNYEKYAKRLTQLVLMNMIEYAPKRKYFHKDPKTGKYETIEVDFPKIPAETLFDYNMNVSSLLPKNKARVAAMADRMMEKQMQYAGAGMDVNLITPQEWLYFQDIPTKEFMLDRMDVERSQNYIEQTTEMIFTYSGLVESGMDPSQAMVQTAKVLENKGRPQAQQAPLEETAMQQFGQGSPLPNQPL